MIATTTANNAAASPTYESPHPNDLIEGLTGRRHLSWSQLNSYRGCPRRWHYSHVEGLEPEFVSSALLLGSAVHTAVQQHYERRLEGQATTLDQLYETFRQAWHAEADDMDIRYPKTEDELSVKDTGCRMLEAFLQCDFAAPSGDLIAIEETLTGSVHPEMPDLVARIDVMWQSDDGLHLMDLKTSKSRWSDAKAEESADQLLLYQRMADGLAGAEDVHLHFGVLTKAKQPQAQFLNLQHQKDRADKVVEVMLPVWDAMEAGVDFASPSPMSCSGCGYQSRCPAYRG